MERGERVIPAEVHALTAPAPTPGAAAPTAARAEERVNAFIRFAFGLFLFSLPFEAVKIGVPLEPTTITLGLLILSAGLQPRLFFQRPPAAFWLFGVFLYLSAMAAALFGIVGEAASRLALQAQLLALCWIVYCLMHREGAAREGLLSLSAGCVVLSLLYLLGIDVPTEKSHAGPERLTFGLDPNQLAGLLGLGALSVLGLAYEFRRRVIKPAALAWALLALVGLAVIGTGSRGGLLALGVGLAGFVFSAGSLWSRVRAVLVVLAGLTFFGVAIVQSDRVRARFERTLEGGDMTLRESSYPLAMRMVLERPVLGWGPIGNAIELGKRLGHPAYPRMDTHNLFLYVLTSTGILGAIPFLLATWLCLRAAWRGRAGPYGVLPLAFLLTTLVADMSVSGLDWKQHWIATGFALAAGGVAGAGSELSKR